MTVCDFPGARTTPNDDAARAVGHAMDPGEQCESASGGMRCSRDRYHAGSHVCRPTEPGKRGMAGWAQTHVEVLNALAHR